MPASASGEAYESQRSLLIKQKHNDRWWRILLYAATSLRVEKHPDLVALGARIRELRKEAKLTQEELASRAGLSANYIGETERGKRNPGALALFAVAQALEISVAGLFDADT
jgi:DNA-binding XRE family transcriptional regulator